MTQVTANVPMTLIEKLQARRDQFNGFSRYEVFDKNDLADAVKMCIDIVEQHSEWISVGERLPKDGIEVLAYSPLGRFKFLAEYVDGIWYDSNNGDLLRSISHWMPITQPPSEVQA